MRLKRLKLISFALILTLLAAMLPACSPISLALFNGENLASGNVEVFLLDDGKEILKTERRINGKGTLELKIPDVEDGEYEILVKSAGFEDKASVSIEKSFLTFLETDKHIYKPGQTIHIRII